MGEQASAGAEKVATDIAAKTAEIHFADAVDQAMSIILMSPYDDIVSRHTSIFI